MVARTADPPRLALIRTALAALALLVASLSAQAGLLRYCDHQSRLSAAEQDLLLRFAAIVKAELEAGSHVAALVSRSGLDLARFGQRYSHAGVSLKAGRDSPWGIRQLYFACDEGRPRLFDQGLSAFVMGGDDPKLSYVSLLLLPEAPAAALARTALDNASALALLGGNYSANAYAWADVYQNCNQWLAELLAAAWGEVDADQPRASAQSWLKRQGYVPTVFELDSRVLMFAAAFVPWLHTDDHPEDELAKMLFHVSMPVSIEAFVRLHVPGVRRVEICHAGARVVVHRGWSPVGEGCVAGAGDQVFELD